MYAYFIEWEITGDKLTLKGWVEDQLLAQGSTRLKFDSMTAAEAYAQYILNEQWALNTTWRKTARRTRHEVAQIN